MTQMMICSGDDTCCTKICSHGRPHNHLMSCEIRACNIDCHPIKDEKPLLEIPGVSFEKEECYLIPVDKLYRTFYETYFAVFPR